MKKILSSQDINYVLEKYNEEIPVQIIANKLDCSISDVTKELRKRGKLRDILSIELNDILNKRIEYLYMIYEKNLASLRLNFLKYVQDMILVKR